MLQMSGALIGTDSARQLHLDTYGLVRDVWILRPEEVRMRPWPTHACRSEDRGVSIRLRRPGANHEQSRNSAPPAVSKKVYIKTFGCQMNEYDSDKMVDVLTLRPRL